jgi:hypothetical protein
MTIEKEIYKKVRTAAIVGFIFLIIFASTFIFEFPVNMFFISVVPLVGLFVSFLYIIFFINCPRCEIELPILSFRSFIPFIKNTGLKSCPNCGLDFTKSE